MKPKLLGSDADLKRLLLRIENYFYSAVTLDGETLSNSKGPIEGFRVTLKAGRYRFELTGGVR